MYSQVLKKWIKKIKSTEKQTNRGNSITLSCDSTDEVEVDI